jgi:hypothetical protein
LRCCSCNHRVKGKRLADTGSRCPNCGHHFVADPPVDVFTDIGLKAAAARVSAQETVSFLPQHFFYELLGRIGARNQRGKWFLIASPVLALLCLIMIVALIRSPHAGLLAFVIMVASGILAIFALGRGLGLRARPGNLPSLAIRFLAINPSKRAMLKPEDAVGAQRGRALGGLGAARQAVVCQNKADAEFLLANDFHLHHACAVLGPAGYLADLYPGLVERLARGPAVEAFVLHDYTPAGLAFASQIKQQIPAWLGRKENVKLIDVGLISPHREALKHVLRPVHQIAGATQGSARMPEDLGTEVTGVRPAVLLSALAVSLKERAPLRLGRDEDRDGGEDEGDSE